MEVYEFRIGNYVYSDNTLVIIESIDKYHGIETTANDNENCNGNIIPIPLTEEWLFKSELDFYNGCWQNKYVIFAHFDDNNLYLTTQNSHTLSKPILYVHQLQNLYFDLTGEELKLTI